MSIEIEDRSKPLEDNSADRERYRVRSSVGFLDPGESLLVRLAVDTDTVNSLGTTHQTLATQLESLLKQSEDERKKLAIGPDPAVGVLFKYDPHPMEKIDPKQQHIHVSHRSFAGSQWSFFRNLDPAAEQNLENTVSWKEDHEIWNEAFSSIVLTISGGIGTGICHFISKHGFYEGGKTNGYRVPPAVLHWILTGIPSPLAISCMKEFYEASKAAAIAKYDLELAELLAPGLDEATKAVISQHLQNSLTEEVEKWDLKLAALHHIFEKTTS